MTANRRSTPPYFDEATGRVDLAGLDAHVTRPEEYDDLPDLSEIDPETADIHQGGELVRRGRGRPKLDRPRRQVTLRLDPDVIDGFRATGPGWQGRINDVLAEAVKKMKMA
ncbi:BrnA antitoxin family protein [uncultured Methylobacterium sp.]|jgi:uncharacterized protein (DUF4415 family)|uniref:BrnA antitoxin family protein n=1 Tax=uncultured Methylobacterium sp. TaxID=157278 RepID=UPI00260ACA4C|nr:BrnA antitoxin family protein [uncultured Methylobacterium sp.]